MRSGDPPNVRHRHILVRPRRGPPFLSYVPIPSHPGPDPPLNNHKQPRPWPMALQGLCTPPFVPLFWAYAATVLTRRPSAPLHGPPALADGPPKRRCLVRCWAGR